MLAHSPLSRSLQPDTAQACSEHSSDQRTKRVCAWCARTGLPGGHWVEQDPFPNVRRVSHGICGDCAADLEVEVQQLAALSELGASAEPGSCAVHSSR